MAVLQFDMESRFMGRTVTFDAYVPSEALKEGETLKALYLLHGVQGSYLNWFMATNLFRITAMHNATCVDSSANGSGEMKGKRICIIMPSAGNGFYHKIPHESDPSWEYSFGHKHDYERFIGEELVEKTRFLLPLSKEREDTAIAGLSMGGYGALRTGLLYSDTFGFAGSLSGAFLTRRSNEELLKAGFYSSSEILSVIYGDFQKARKDPREDVQEMILSMAKEGKKLPELYMACGRQDPLRPLSTGLHEALEEAKIPHTYEERDGAHEWGFWEWGLSRILEHL